MAMPVGGPPVTFVSFAAQLRARPSSPLSGTLVVEPSVSRLRPRAFAEYYWRIPLRCVLASLRGLRIRLCFVTLTPWLRMHILFSDSGPRVLYLCSSTKGGSPNSSPSRLWLLLGGFRASIFWHVKRRPKHHPSDWRACVGARSTCSITKREILHGLRHLQSCIL